MKRTWLDLWVGLFVAAGIGALLILALKVGNLSSFDSGHGYAVMAEFDDVGGLKERAPVKSSGVVVGRVADIQFDDKAYEARVTLRIDSAFKFPRDTSAAIMTSGLLGEQYVALEAGGDPVMLADGDSITLTQSAIVLENLIGQLLFDKAQRQQERAPHWRLRRPPADSVRRGPDPGPQAARRSGAIVAAARVKAPDCGPVIRAIFYASSV